MCSSRLCLVCLGLFIFSLLPGSSNCNKTEPDQYDQSSGNVIPEEDQFKQIAKRDFFISELMKKFGNNQGYLTHHGLDKLLHQLGFVDDLHKEHDDHMHTEHDNHVSDNHDFDNHTHHSHMHERSVQNMTSEVSRCIQCMLNIVSHETKIIHVQVCTCTCLFKVTMLHVHVHEIVYM